MEKGGDIQVVSKLVDTVDNIITDEDADTWVFLEDEDIETKNTIVVYTDGSCRSNGTERAYAGVGIHFEDDLDSRNQSFDDVPLPHTNQRAELWAIRKVFEVLRDNGDDELEIRSDSEYAVNVINLKYGAKVNLDIIRPIWALRSQRKGVTRIVWVPRRFNKKADKLARKATRKRKR